jgi:hypothetical protein
MLCFTLALSSFLPNALPRFKPTFPRRTSAHCVGTFRTVFPPEGEGKVCFRAVKAYKEISGKAALILNLGARWR